MTSPFITVTITARDSAAATIAHSTNGTRLRHKVPMAFAAEQVLDGLCVSVDQLLGLVEHEWCVGRRSN